jgi:YD repeat-containing protein
MTKTLLRAGALSCALLSSTALSSNALAQTGAPYRNLDANGVDLSRGDYLMQLTEGSIGSGRGRLSLVREGGYISGYNGHHWDSIQLYETASARGVSFGQQRTETFTGTNSSLANGATLTLSGVNYFHQASDGTVTTFVRQDPNCSPGPSGFCMWIPTSITSPDGGSIDLTWDQWEVCNDLPIDEGYACVVDSIRLGNVSNSKGYSIFFTYAGGSTGSSTNNMSGPGPTWFQRSRADFYNSAVSGSSQGNVTYSYPSINVTDVTDMGGLTWRVTGGSLVSGIRRPGASSDTTTISRSGYVTSVTRDGVTTNYSYSVSGSTATMVVTDANSEQTTIVSDTTIGRPTSVTDPLSRTTSYQYDSAGRLTRITAPLGNYVSYTYDSRGNVTETRGVAQSGSGLADIVATASFDSSCSNPVTCNQPNSTTDALGNTTSYTYDSTHGGVLTATAPAVGGVSPETRYTYALDSGTGEYRLTEVSACASGTAGTCVGTANGVAP